MIYNVISLLFMLLATSAETIDKIVATVNSRAITQSDVQEFNRKLRANGLVDEALLAMYDRKLLLNQPSALVNFLVDEHLLDLEIERLGLVAPIEQVESEIRNIARQRGLDRSQLVRVLQKEGVAFSDYQDFVKTSLQRQSLMQREVTSKIKISDEEVSAYYIANFSRAKALEYEYTLAHILFLNSNGGANEASKRAALAYDKITQGIPFETLAAQYSEDPQFVQGGLFGTFRKSDFNQDVAQIISQLAINDVSSVVKMPDGYRIFKVLKKTLVPSPDLERRRPEIQRLLLSQNFKKQFALWLEQKRKDAYIRIN